MSTSESIDPEAIREAIRSCPPASVDSWNAGVSLVTGDGQRIRGNSVYLRDRNTAVISTPDGEVRIPVASITGVISHLESRGPE